MFAELIHRVDSIVRSTQESVKSWHKYHLYTSLLEVCRHFMWSLLYQHALIPTFYHQFQQFYFVRESKCSLFFSHFSLKVFQLLLFLFLEIFLHPLSFIPKIYIIFMATPKNQVCSPPNIFCTKKSFWRYIYQIYICSCY